MENTGDSFYPEFSLQIAQLKSLNEEYSDLTDWLTRYEKLSKEWVDELSKINEGAAKGSVISPSKWVLLDKNFQAASVLKPEKQSLKDLLADKIQGMATYLFTVHEEIKKWFEADKISRDEYIMFLKKYRVAIESGSKHVFYVTVASREVRIAVKEYLTGKAA